LYALITDRIFACIGISIVAVLSVSPTVFAQAPELQSQISNYQLLLDKESSELSREQMEETTDERLLRHLKSGGGVKYVQQKTTLTKEIEQEERFEFECRNNINNLRAWIVYDQTQEQKAEMEAQYARHNAEEAEIDAEVERRKRYVPPVSSSYASPLWGTTGDTYGGYGGGGHFHSDGGGTHWHSGGGGGGHSGGGGGHSAARGRR
jgi:hypothetical protein